LLPLLVVLDFVYRSECSCQAPGNDTEHSDHDLSSMDQTRFAMLVSTRYEGGNRSDVIVIYFSRGGHGVDYNVHILHDFVYQSYALLCRWFLSHN
jgi:hypothetical protein